MGSQVERPFTTICPRTGSRAFVCDELLNLTEPIEVICPICDHWHIWNPATLTLAEADDVSAEVAPMNSN